MGGTLPKNQNPSFLSASFYLILAVDLSIGSPFFLLFGDDAKGLRALTITLLMCQVAEARANGDRPEM
jgi:hypothetical protein